jgi:Glycosyltransferase sugar-binding region containing DXD motif
MTDTIQTLWIGNRLSQMERIALASFVQLGHQVHLYAYTEVANVPDGVVMQNGNQVIPATMLLESKAYKSYAECADLFRYKLLLDQGGYWVDTDVVCLKPFDFEQPFVFALEATDPVWRKEMGPAHATNSVLKAPKGSAIMACAFETALAKEPQLLVWGEIGPVLMEKCITVYGLEAYVQDIEVFCPLGPWQWQRLLEPGADVGITGRSYSIHLCQDMWRRAHVNKDQTFHPDCFYERLKRRLLT